MIEMNCGKRGSSFHNLESDRACGGKVDVKFIASLMDNLTGNNNNQFHLVIYSSIAQCSNNLVI